MTNPCLTVVTGRGTHSVTNRKGAMAVITHAVIRVFWGKVTSPYAGSQELNIFDLSVPGLRLLERLSSEAYRGDVSNLSQLENFMKTQISKLLLQMVTLRV